MKKIVSLLLAVLLLVFCFGFVVGATEDYTVPFDEYCELPANQNITFSKDLKNLYVGEHSYSRVKFADGMYETEYLVPNLKILDDNTIDEVDLTANKKGNVIYAIFYYKDGAVLSCNFMDDDNIEEYNDLLNGKLKYIHINFGFYGENYLKVDIQKLKSKKVEMKTEDFYFSSEGEFSGYAITSDESISVGNGTIYIMSDKMYYCFHSDNEDNLGEDGEKWILYEIVDQQLIEDIKAKQKEYYSEMDYGVFSDDEISKTVAVFVCVVFFVILPFVVMVGAIIFAIRSKRRIYRRMFIVVSFLAALQTIIFVVVSFILFK